MKIRIGYELNGVDIMETVTEDEAVALMECPYVNVILCWILEF